MKLTKEFLYVKYIVEGLSVPHIVLLTGLTQYQIKNALRRYGIRKKPLLLGNEKYDNEDWLYDQYIIQGKGYTVIAKELGVAYTTILDRILYFGWELRGHKDIDKSFPRKGKKHTQKALQKIASTRVKKRVTFSRTYCMKKSNRVLSMSTRSKIQFCSQICFRQFLKENRVETEEVTNSAEYKEWRLKVYKRDNYRCKMPGCNSKSRDIAAHHIYPKKIYPHLQFDVNNGITLCRICHEKTYGKEEQFVDALVRVIQKMND